MGALRFRTRLYGHVLFTSDAEVTLYWAPTHWTAVQFIKAACADACVSRIQQILNNTYFLCFSILCLIKFISYLHGKRALDNGKYWQTTHSCSPELFHKVESSFVGQTRVRPTGPGPPSTGSATANGICPSSYPPGLPVAKYSCCNFLSHKIKNNNFFLFRDRIGRLYAYYHAIKNAFVVEKYQQFHKRPRVKNWSYLSVIKLSKCDKIKPRTSLL